VVGRPVGAKGSASPRPWVLDKSQSCPGAAFQFGDSKGVTTLTTGRLTVSLSAAQGALTVKTLAGETLIREYPNLPRTYLSASAPSLYHVEDRFNADSREGIYGLGQHQSGIFNYRGSTVELAQNNTDVAI